MSTTKLVLYCITESREHLSLGKNTIQRRKTREKIIQKLYLRSRNPASCHEVYMDNVQISGNFQQAFPLLVSSKVMNLGRLWLVQIQTRQLRAAVNEAIKRA